MADGGPPAPPLPQISPVSPVVPQEQLVVPPVQPKAPAV